MYESAIASAARAQRNRDVAKRKTRPRDRACNQPKPRQGWTRAALRERNARTVRGVREDRGESGPLSSGSSEDGERGDAGGGRGRRERGDGRSAYVCKTRALVRGRGRRRGRRCIARCGATWIKACTTRSRGRRARSRRRWEWILRITSSYDPRVRARDGKRRANGFRRTRSGTRHRAGVTMLVIDALCILICNRV